MRSPPSLRGGLSEEHDAFNVLLDSSKTERLLGELGAISESETPEGGASPRGRGGDEDDEGFTPGGRSRKQGRHRLHRKKSRTIRATDSAGAEALGQIVASERQQFRLRLAVCHIRNAVHGRSGIFNETRRGLCLYRLYHSRLWRGLFAFVCLVQLSLAIFEGPVASESPFANFQAPASVVVSVEFACLIFFLTDIIVHSASRPFRVRGCKYCWWTMARLVLVILLAADWAAYGIVVFKDSDTSFTYPRYTRCLRPLFVVFRFRKVRTVFRGALEWRGPTIMTFLLMSTAIVAFGAFGYLLFEDPDVDESNRYFRTFGNALYNVLMVCTSNAFLLKLQGPYLKRWSIFAVLYFVLLEILTTVFFANLVIAVSYRSYKEYASNKLISRLQKRQASLRKAFTLLLSTKPGRRKSSHEGPGSPLSSPPFSPNAATSANGLNDDGGDDDDDGLDTLSMGAGHGLGMGMGITTPRREADDAFESNFFRNGQADETHNSSSSSSSDDGEDDLSLEQWLLLFLFERNKKNLARVVGTEIYTSVLEQSPMQRVAFPEFCQLCTLYEIRIFSQPSFKKCSPCMRSFINAMRWSVTAPIGTFAVDLLVLLSVVQTFAVMRLDEANAMWDYVGDGLQLVFAIELSIKLVVFNRREFFGSLLNRLDLVTVIISILFNAAQNFFWQIDMMSEAGADMVQILEVAYCLRMVRFVRPLTKVGAVSDIFEALSKSSQAMTRAFVVYCSLFYFWATIACTIYCGVLTGGLSNDTVLNQTQWYPYRDDLNFDDFLQGSLTMFELTLLSNWPIVMEAAELKVSWSQAFFFTFRVSTSMVIMPLLVGFIIQSFLSHWRHHSIAAPEIKFGSEEASDGEESDEMVSPVAAPQSGLRFRQAAAPKNTNKDKAIEGRLDKLRYDSYKQRKSRRKCNQRCFLRFCCSCCHRKVYYSSCWRSVRKLFQAEELSEHASEVRIVSGENGNHERDIRLYNKQRNCVNEGMHREVERALLASQQQSSLENELAAAKLKLQRLDASEARQRRRIEEMGRTIARQSMILRRKTPSILPEERTTAAEAKAVLDRQKHRRRGSKTFGSQEKLRLQQQSASKSRVSSDSNIPSMDGGAGRSRSGGRSVSRGRHGSRERSHRHSVGAHGGGGGGGGGGGSALKASSAESMHRSRSTDDVAALRFAEANANSPAAVLRSQHQRRWKMRSSSDLAAVSASKTLNDPLGSLV